MNKLVVAWIVENDRDVFPVSYDSVKEVADVSLIIDGNHYGDSEEIDYVYEMEPGVRVTRYSPFPHDNKGADGIQRNAYLDYLKEHHLGDWCLVIDADEVVANPERIKETINKLEELEVDACDIHMRHFVGNLGQEDATVQEHYVPKRLFKVSEDLKYTEQEHSTLIGFKKLAKTNAFTIWHLNNTRDIIRLRDKYRNNLAKSEVHSRQFLDNYYHAHAFGQYPRKPIPFSDIPDSIKDFFDINSDFMYFSGRNLETKHFVDAKHWIDHFGARTALEIGCGLGHRVFAMRVAGIDACGIEKSDWAVDNSTHTDTAQGDILDLDSIVHFGDNFDLVVLYDILEHVEEDVLSLALDNAASVTNPYGGRVLISVPFEGDPNLLNDPTHKIFRPRSWWEEQVKKAGFVLEEVPMHFLFGHQLIIGRKE